MINPFAAIVPDSLYRHRITHEIIMLTSTQYIYYNSPYFLNTKGLWENWPIRELNGIMKAYLLPQWAFWLQQILVVHIEERRKDHWQMLTHHFVTVTLIAACYAYHHTRVGNLILVLMDVVDLFLPVSFTVDLAFYRIPMLTTEVGCQVPQIYGLHDVV